MADTVHVHETRDGGGMGWLAVVIAILLLIVVVWFLFAGGGGEGGGAEIDAGTTIEVPDEIDVNVNPPAGQ